MTPDEDAVLRSIVHRIRVATPDRLEAEKQFGQWFRGGLSGVQVCALILGESGAGKTIIAEMIVRQYGEKRLADGVRRKIALVQTPDAPTAKALLEAILTALGDPRPEHGTRTGKGRRLMKMLRDQGVLFIILDDVQQLVDKATDSIIYDASECLKTILKQSGVSIVGVGLIDAKKLIESNEQWERLQVAAVHVNRFDWDRKVSKAQFIAVLRAFHKAIAMFDLPRLADGEMPLRFYLATGGLITYIEKILTKAIWNALDSGTRKITLKGLSIAWKEAVWAAETLGFNPLDPDFKISDKLDDHIIAAKKISVHRPRPIPKSRNRRGRLAAIGLAQ